MPQQFSKSDDKMENVKRKMEIMRIEKERLIVDEMGSDMVLILVGPHKQKIGIHKNLLCATSPSFAGAIDALLADGKDISFSTESPTMFKLFVEFLYTKKVPRVRANADPIDQANRLKDLCQMYTFTEKYAMRNEIRNSVMDTLQDGFLQLKKFPQGGLMQDLFSNTVSGSPLRRFAISGLLYNLRCSSSTEKPKDHGILATFLSDNFEIHKEFLASVQSLDSTTNLDPRVRDCGGEAGCGDCIYKRHMTEPGSGGVWPCFFHVHTTVAEDLGGEGGVDDGCYLWEL